MKNKTISSWYFFLFLLLLLPVVTAEKVLILGDSHTGGPFGAELESLMKKAGHQVEVYGCWGATASDFINGGKNCNSVSFLKSSSSLGPYTLPSVDSIVNSFNPSVVVVALGANFISSPEQSLSLAQKVAGKTCYWVGPPLAPDPAYQPDPFYQQFTDSIGNCKLIDSRISTQFNFCGTNSCCCNADIHFNRQGTRNAESEAVAKQWAKSVFNQVTSGLKMTPVPAGLAQLGAQSISTYEGCKNKRMGVVGASNTVLQSYRDDLSEIIQEKCLGSTVFLSAKGGYGPKQMVPLVKEVLQNDNLDYVILDPSANSQGSITSEEYKDAVIALAQLVKDKNKNSKVVVLANTPVKGSALANAQQNIDAFNSNLLTTKLGRSDLIDFAVDAYSATEDPSGSDSCGKYCSNDNVHFGSAGERKVAEATLNTVFGSPTSSVISTSLSLPSPSLSSGEASSTGCSFPQRCKEIDEVWNKISAFVSQLRKGKIWDTARGWVTFGESSAPSIQLTPLITPGSTASGSCPPEMANIDNKYCIDKWEASVVDKNTNAEASPHYNPLRKGGITADWMYNQFVNRETKPAGYPMPERGAEASPSFEPKAVSVPGKVPASFVTRQAAELACANAGKRLCNHQEWYKACAGPDGPSSGKAYPYGTTYQVGKCNVNLYSGWPPLIIGRTNQGNDMMDPRIGTVKSNGVEMKQPTQSFPECVNEYGVFDMVGNVHEIIADVTANGRANYVGAHFARPGPPPQTVEGQGCHEITGFHDPISYTDYSIGFRCCSDLAASGPTNNQGTSPSTLSPSGAATSQNNIPQYDSSVVSSPEIARTRTKEVKPNFIPDGTPTFTNVRATAYKTADFTGSWCSPTIGSCLTSTSQIRDSFPNTASCLDNIKGAWCCIPDSAKGFYEQVKCQGGGIYQGKGYRYDTIQTTLEASPSYSIQAAALTSSQTTAVVSRTIAVNPLQGTNCYIPFGSWVYTKFKISPSENYLNAPNDGWYLAEDTGGAFRGACKIDYYGGFGPEIDQFNAGKGDYADVWVYPPTQ